MLLRVAAISIAAAACAEPVVELELQMPTNLETFDASCVSAVSVMVTGGNIQNDINDYTWSCQEITSQQKLSGVHAEIRGKFKIDIPGTGLSGVEIFGFAGPQPCTPPDLVSPDLIFHASAPYIGQDSLQLKLETTLDCARSTVKVRPVELFKLVSGATPSAANCTTAIVPDGMGYAALGTIMERPFSPGVDFWGGFRWADVAGGVASFSAATTGANDTCIAYDTDNVLGFGTGCAMMSGGKVCAAADEIDAPFVNGDIERESLALDEAMMAKWDSRVFVSVWDSGNPKKPLAGARLEIAATDGAVVYVDPPASGLQLTKRTDSATGPSGLAIVYTNKLANVKVTTAGGMSRDVTVAAPDWSVGAAMVVMP